MTREGAGPVAHDSLAAESVRGGGGFAANRGAEPRGANDHRGTSASSYAHYGHHNHGDGSTTTQGAAAAPTAYATTADENANARPHGKNLSEGGFAGAGPGASIDAEPGSARDPARFRGPGEQGEPGGAELETGTAYDGLAREAGA